MGKKREGKKNSSEPVIWISSSSGKYAHSTDHSIVNLRQGFVDAGRAGWFLYNVREIHVWAYEQQFRTNRQVSKLGRSNPVGGSNEVWRGYQ
jgi:hypothetical protein